MKYPLRPWFEPSVTTFHASARTISSPLNGVTPASAHAAATCAGVLPGTSENWAVDTRTGSRAAPFS